MPTTNHYFYRTTEFFKQIVHPNLGDKPFFVVLSQADKIEPFRDWDEEHHVPGAKQQQNLNVKCQELGRFFHIYVSRVIPLSAHEKYNLVHLVNQIVFALPKERKVTFTKAVKEEARSKEAKKDAEEGFFEVVGEIVGEIFGVSKIAKGIGKIVDNFIRGFFGGWWE